MSLKYQSNFSHIKMVKNSLTHNILMLTKFYARKINIEDLRVINPNSYANKNKVSRSILKLKLDNLIITYDDDSWAITNKGIAYLYDFAATHKNNNQDD